MRLLCRGLVFPGALSRPLTMYTWGRRACPKVFWKMWRFGRTRGSDVPVAGRAGPAAGPRRGREGGPRPYIAAGRTGKTYIGWLKRRPQLVQCRFLSIYCMVCILHTMQSIGFTPYMPSWRRSFRHPMYVFPVLSITCTTRWRPKEGPGKAHDRHPCLEGACMRGRGARSQGMVVRTHTKWRKDR